MKGCAVILCSLFNYLVPSKLDHKYKIKCCNNIVSKNTCDCRLNNYELKLNDGVIKLLLNHILFDIKSVKLVGCQWQGWFAVPIPSRFHCHSLTHFICRFVSKWLSLIIRRKEAKVLVATGVSLETWYPLLTHAFPLTTDWTNHSPLSGCWLDFINSVIPRKKTVVSFTTIKKHSNDKYEDNVLKCIMVCPLGSY